MAQKWSILGKKWPNMAGLSTFQRENLQPKEAVAKNNHGHNFLNNAFKANQHGLNPLVTPRSKSLRLQNKEGYQVCKMQNAKLVLRVQRWLAPTCPWVTGGRRGLCLASREEAAASPGLQALETHIRESHFMKSFFLTPHFHLEDRAWCCWQMAIYIQGRRSVPTSNLNLSEHLDVWFK